MTLSEMPEGAKGRVVSICARQPNDPISKRLRELGFIEGQAVSVVARGPLGGEPLAVAIGATRFALRKTEASRVVVRIGS